MALPSSRHVARLDIYLRRSLFISAWIFVCAAIALGGNISASAQDDLDIKFYGYFSPDMSTAVTLGHMKPEQPGLAAEIVSPQYADDFFSGFTVFTDHEFASDLSAGYLAQIADADEYMVFKGDIDSYDGIKPGYLIFLSEADQVFVLFAYQSDADVLFDLAEQTIREQTAPTRFSDFERIELSSSGEIDSAQSSSTRAKPTPRPSTTSSTSSSSTRDQSAAVFANPNNFVGQDVVVSGEVMVIAQETDGTTYILISDDSNGSFTAFLAAYPGSVRGVSEGDRVTIRGVVIGAEDFEGELLPLIIASDVN